MGDMESDILCDLIKKISLNNIDVGSSCWVTIQHIINPSSFYVRRIECENYLAKAVECGDAIEPSDLQIRSKVVFKSRILQNYTRGIVCSINNVKDNLETVDVFAMDEGFKEKSVKLKNIYLCKFACIPPMAVHCELADCYPPGDDWTQKEIDALKTFIGKEKAYMMIKEKRPSKLSVYLMNSCPDDITTMMILTDNGLLGCLNQVGRLTVPAPEEFFFTYKEPKVGQILNVRLQFGKELNEFYVAEKQDYKEYLQGQNDMTYFFRQTKQLKTEELVENLPVGVRIDNLYERGIVKEVVSENKARVQLVDCGRVDVFSILLMKPMLKRYFDNPAIAIYCTLAEDEVLDHRFKKYLYPGYEFKIEIVEKGEEFCKPNIVKLLPAT